jgi:hypothetical protein
MSFVSLARQLLFLCSIPDMITMRRRFQLDDLTAFHQNSQTTSISKVYNLNSNSMDFGQTGGLWMDEKDLSNTSIFGA